METRNEVKEYVLRKLGAPELAIELTDGHLNDAVDDALRLFNRYMLTVTHKTSSEVYGSAYIDLEDDVRGVYYVTFMMTNNLLNYTQVNIFEILSRMVYPEMPMGEWYMIRMFYQMFQRVRGTEPEWIYDQGTNRLWLDGHGGPWDVMYVVSTDITIDSILKERRKKYERDFLEACLAYAKQTLSLIRRKFGGIPAPGGTIQTDGTELQSEAKEKLEEIETKLKRLNAARVLPRIG